MDPGRGQRHGSEWEGRGGEAEGTAQGAGAAVGEELSRRRRTYPDGVHNHFHDRPSSPFSSEPNYGGHSGESVIFTLFQLVT